jgi:hypothetical protein
MADHKYIVDEGQDLDGQYNPGSPSKEPRIHFLLSLIMRTETLVIHNNI